MDRNNLCYVILLYYECVRYLQDILCHGSLHDCCQEGVLWEDTMLILFAKHLEAQIPPWTWSICALNNWSFDIFCLFSDSLKFHLVTWMKTITLPRSVVAITEDSENSEAWTLLLLPTIVFPSDDPLYANEPW